MAVSHSHRLSISVTEKKAVIAALESGEHETPDDAARAAIHAFLEVREKRTHYTVLIIPKTSGAQPVPTTFGAFSSLDSAAGSVWSGQAPGLAGDLAYVIRHYPAWHGLEEQ